MNLFVTSPSPQESAAYLDDRRLIKQILECNQVLSGNFRHHPITKWVQAADDNKVWTRAFLLACCREYTARFGKIHQYDDLSIITYSTVPTFYNLAENRTSGISFAHMSDTYEAYRLYLANKWMRDKKPSSSRIHTSSIHLHETLK